MKTFKLRQNTVMIAVLAGWICCSLVTTASETKDTQAGKIEAGKQKYVAKNHQAWKTQGRIVGIAKQAPAFTVTILTSDKKEIKTVKAESLKTGSKAYEIWLKPGTYIMVVKAGGYQCLDINGLKVKKGNDLRIDLEFTKTDK